MLEVDGLTKCFGPITAVNDVGFRVDRAGMIGVIGRSGAGKSTLLRCINRLETATRGRIVCRGRDILALTGADRRRWQRDCAMIFQQFNLVPRLDVLTNVMLGRLNGKGRIASLLKSFSRDDRIDALAALERLGLVDSALQRAETLSGGQQQRTAIARALMQRPWMILADEPIASLDPVNAKTVMASLRDIHERDGLTIFCNLHSLDTARSYCDRILGMAKGRLVFDGPPEDLTSATLHAIYGADVEFDDKAVVDPSSRPTGTRPRLGTGAAAQPLPAAAS